MPTPETINILVTTIIEIWSKSPVLGKDAANSTYEIAVATNNHILLWKGLTKAKGNPNTTNNIPDHRNSSWPICTRPCKPLASLAQNIDQKPSQELGSPYTHWDPFEARLIISRYGKKPAENIAIAITPQRIRLLPRGISGHNHTASTGRMGANNLWCAHPKPATSARIHPIYLTNHPQAWSQYREQAIKEKSTNCKPQLLRHESTYF